MSRPKPQLVAISVPASQQVKGVDAYIKLPFTADFIFNPQTVPDPTQGEGYRDNGDANAIFGIRINDPNGVQLIFSVNSNYGSLAVFEGAIEAIYITRLDANGVLPNVFYIGTDCNIGSVGAVF